jgi:hypothetical protein
MCNLYLQRVSAPIFLHKTQRSILVTTATQTHMQLYDNLIVNNAFKSAVYAHSIKFTLEQAKKAQRGSRGIALLFFNHGARWG